MAHDWGAVLAWRLVIQYPDLFTAHISMNGPHPGAFGKHLNSSFKQIRMSWFVFVACYKKLDYLIAGPIYLPDRAWKISNSFQAVGLVLSREAKSIVWGRFPRVITERAVFTTFIFMVEIVEEVM